MDRTRGKPVAASKKFAHLLYKAGLRAHTPHGCGCGKGPRPDGDRRQMHELSFHSLRHTARTLLEESGVPVLVIDAFVGHHGDQGRDLHQDRRGGPSVGGRGIGEGGRRGKDD